MASGLTSVGSIKGRLTKEQELKGKIQNGSFLKGNLSITKKSLNGVLSKDHTLKGLIKSNASLKGKLSVSSDCGHEPYEGDYDVDPAFEQKTLRTKNKVMYDDVSVNPIGVSRVSNPSGGTTVYIGGIINA